MFNRPYDENKITEEEKSHHLKSKEDVNCNCDKHVLHWGGNKSYPSNHFFSYRFIMTLRLSRQCKNVKVQDTRGLHRPPDQ